MNVILPVLILSRIRKYIWHVWRLWLTVYIGNVLGAMFLGGMLNAAKIVDPVADNLKHLLHEKMVSDSLEDEI
tara:strand:+ start:3496 stop:3714 length:219 start_codon:yes stop_codon:yes gene_type:complete